ncbi:MAG: hypothetical protein Q4B92_05665 [Ruminococcus sp.]|nr:hypothetical protein [Ruminococcus sp.]
MNKRIISICLMIFTFVFCVYGCENKEENTDKSVITDNTFNIGLLLPEGNETSTEIESGVMYAHSLANTVNLEETVNVNYIEQYYKNGTDVKLCAESLITNGVSTIIYSGDDLDAYNSLCDYVSKIEIPVISLSPYSSSCDNFFSLTLSPKFISSCAATYAMEKGYSHCAVLCENSEKYYSDFAQTYKNTLNSYIGTEPTVYYNSGELENYSPSALVSGNYDYLLLIASQTNREDLVTELRNSGFNGEIMLTEVLSKGSLKNNIFDRCSFISKLEEDSSNNISTVFCSAYAEQAGIGIREISPSVAYGYDAYMTAFEALKSFAPKKSSLSFSNEGIAETDVTSQDNDILLSEYTDALINTIYFGVTDTIKFKEHSSVPTYIYVDNIINADILFGSKYTFASD